LKEHNSAADGSGGSNDPAVPLVPTMRYGKLIFVDLAGSENLKQSKSSGADAMAETCAINKSLFTLGAVISLLSDMAKGKKAPTTHVPFRNSVLTKLLAESLAGRGMAMMLACVSPSSMHASETLRTLMYADRARNIRTKPTINNALINHNKDELIFALRRDVKQLTMENGILRALLQQHNIPLPDVEALVRARVLREGGGGAVSNLLGGGGRGSALATGRRPGAEGGSGESEWLRLNSRGGTAHKSSANLLSPGSVAAAAAAADGAISPVDSARGSALDAAMALASGNNNRRSKRAAGTRSSMGGAGGRHPIHHSIGGGGGGGGAAGGGSAFEPLTGQETLEELRQALLDARAFIDDHMQSEGGGGNLFSSPTGDSSSSSPGQMAKKKGSKARQQYQQQGGGFENDSSDPGLRAAFGKGGGVGGGASGDGSSDNDGGSGNSSGPGSLANSQKSNKNKRLEVDSANQLLHPSALSSQVSSGLPSGRDGPGGLVVDTFTSDVDDDVDANLTPRSLRASNRSLRATIASLRRTVALLETGPAVGKDLSDDYDCLSPNKRKAVSELFALKKNNVRLMKQVMQANQIVKEAEEREKRLEDELTRLRKAVADDKAAAAAAAASSTLPAASIPLLPHGVGRADGGDAYAFVHGSMGMVLPGGARPTLSLSIPAPGAPSAKVRGPDPPPATSSLTTSSSAALSVSHSHPSVTTTSSPYTPSAAGAAVSPRVLPHYAQQPLRTHYPPPPQHVPYAAPSYSGGAAGGFPQQVQIPVGVVGGVGGAGAGSGGNNSSTSSFQPSPSQSPIFVPSPEQPPRSLQNSASMRRLQAQQQPQLQQLQQAQPTSKQSAPSSAKTKQAKSAVAAAATVPALATAAATSVDTPVSSRYEQSEAAPAVADPAAVQDAVAAAATEEAEAAALAAEADRRADEADAAADAEADAAVAAAAARVGADDAEFDAEAEADAEAAEQAEVDAQLREDDAALDALSMDAAQMDEAMQGHSGEEEAAAAAQEQQEGEEDGGGEGEGEAEDDAAAAAAAADADPDADADADAAEEEETDADAGGEEEDADAADGEAEADVAAAADADSAADDAADEDGPAEAEAEGAAAAVADDADADGADDAAPEE
jgi:hypothetical protein